ncbi:MAG: toxic anion resistance protein [Clostridia bacterium]|nr:toxic anion resistance protein [Clostridia bacterium]
MAINFNSASSQQKPAAPLTVPAAPEPEIIEAPAYDAEADRKAVAEEFKRSPEIDALTATIDVSDMTTIVTFGASSAEEIAKASDIVLRSISASELDQPSQLMNALAKVMDQFDINEIRENPGLFGKLFGGLKKQLDKILAKYQTMGDQVDKIYTELRKYEDEIKRSNVKLDTMFDANVNYFHELVKYIVAGEQGVEEIGAYIEQRRKDYEATGDNAITFEIQSLEQARDMLSQRVQDLRTAEIVAMQSIPMIRTMQYSNMNLVRKINSAFIVTLPVFKQQLAQAVLLKRQKLQAEAISALDERTNEMLLANARNAVETSKITTRLATGSSIKAETLEASWRTIVNGIEETRKIQESAADKRKEDKEKLEKIKAEFMGRFEMPERR